jgi:hypothetical protein
MAPQMMQRAGRAFALCAGSRAKNDNGIVIKTLVPVDVANCQDSKQRSSKLVTDNTQITEDSPKSTKWILGNSSLRPITQTAETVREAAGDDAPESASSEDGSPPSPPQDILRLESVKKTPKDGKVFIARHSSHEVRQPADGSCLFHALSYGLNDGTSARRLRREICQHMKDNPDMEIASMALQDWIQFDTGRSVRRYVEKMAAGAEGGGIEMEVFTRLKGMSVHVYERCSGGYRRIGFFNAGLESKGDVHVLYRKRMHYDSLVLDSHADVY